VIVVVTAHELTFPERDDHEATKITNRAKQFFVFFVSFVVVVSGCRDCRWYTSVWLP
jgi:uncharacterized membrane protein